MAGSASAGSSHTLLADEVAESIGWPAGSPFQLEVAFSNLALGILGVLASADGHAEEPATLGPWRDTVVTAGAHATAVVAATVSLGYAVNQSAIGAAVGSLLAAAAITDTVSRAARRHG